MATEKEKQAIMKWTRENKVTISTSIYRADAERLDEYCRAHGMTRSALLTGFIESCIGPLTRRSEQGNDNPAPAEGAETTG